MIGTVSPDLQGSFNRNYCRDQFKDIPSEELTELVKHLFEANRNRKVNGLYLYFGLLEDDLFMCSGACDVLRERHGDDYVGELTGLIRPKTFCERWKYYILGTLPKYRSKQS